MYLRTYILLIESNLITRFHISIKIVNLNILKSGLEYLHLHDVMLNDPVLLRITKISIGSGILSRSRKFLALKRMKTNITCNNGSL